MKVVLRFVTITLLLTFGLNGMANAGDIEKRSLPISGLGFACQLVNVSSNEITYSMSIQARVGQHGIGIRGSLAPDEVMSIGLQQGESAYCKIQYAGRPGDIVATFCALDELGSCTVLVPLD